MKNVVLLLVLIYFHPVTKAQDMPSMSDTSKKTMTSGMKMNRPVRKSKNPHKMSSMKDTTIKPMKESMQAMDTKMGMGMNMPMSHSYSLNLPMNRNGSGTSWLPDSSPVYGYMIPSKKWMYMIHGNIAIRYDKQDVANKGSRGSEQWNAPNWFMFMAQTNVGKKGLFHFNSMLSFDAITVGGGGYPLLFQTGESWKEKALVDYQHPHDLFSELSVAYSYAFSKKSDLSFYVGYPGEPALGSVAFMHRPSALANPDAPISHHWNDGTHITFGVATIGYRFDKFKLEASSFTGREPNENRYNFDKPTFDSWSGRISFNPDKNWALQVSHGHIKSPESLHPEENVKRTTASATFSYPFNKGKFLNATALWGLNKIKGQDAENAALLEADLRLMKVDFYTRYEWVQKSREELNLDENIYGQFGIYPINAVTLGFNYDLIKAAHTRVAIGSQLSYFSADSRLNSLYGKNPISFEAFIRIYPELMK